MKIRTVVLWYVTCAAVGTLCAGEVAPEMTLCRPGAVKPAGWLRDYAVKVRDGFTARMDEVHDEFKRAWSADFKPRGPHLQWNGPEDWSGSKGIYSWSAEGGSYWFDGLAKLSAQLGDAELVALAKRRFEPLLAGMNPKAVGFLWWLDRTDPAQLREALDQGSWNVGWVLGNSAKAVAAYYEVTRDERAAKALEWAFDCREHTARYGGNTTVWRCRTYWSSAAFPPRGRRLCPSSPSARPSTAPRRKSARIRIRSPRSPGWSTRST